MGMRILLVEDNPDNLELMTYLLAARGHTLLTADDGEEGLEAAQRLAPDLIVCDIQLPRMSGLEVALRLKSDPTLAATPLVAVTAFAMVGDRDRMLAAGFDGYVAKPIDPETFAERVEAFLRADQRTAQPPAPAASLPSPPPPKRTTTVLVVDNRPVNLELARSLLEPSGYHVITASGMGEALAQVRVVAPDLILSDVCMDDGEGYDFLRAVKADPELRAVPFLFLTATARDEKSRAKGLALGAARFLFRPLDPALLLAEVEACLCGKPEVRYGDDPGGG